MEHDLATQVTALRAELDALTRDVRPLLDERAGRRNGGPEGDRGRGGQQGRRSGSGVSPAAEALGARAQTERVPGFLTRYGYYGAGGRSSTWSTEAQPAAALLDQDVGQVARVLTALGHPQRLRLLKAILQEQASATELVARLGLGTTGQAYHHLHLLQAADLIEPVGEAEARGQFVFKAHRVQGFLTILAGVCDLLDPRHSAGVWTEATQDAVPGKPAGEESSG